MEYAAAISIYSGSQKSEVCPMPYVQSYLIFRSKGYIFLLPLYFTIIVVHLIAICCKLLENKYLFQERGIIEVKGKGKMKTYLLIGKK
jgi:hypothetical protein